MSDEKEDKDPLHPARPNNLERNVREHPETNFLPPLNMFLTFFDKESRQKKKKASQQEEPDEKSVEKLIEKLSKSDEENESKK